MFVALIFVLVLQQLTLTFAMTIYYIAIITNNESVPSVCWYISFTSAEANIALAASKLYLASIPLRSPLSSTIK